MIATILLVSLLGIAAGLTMKPDKRSPKHRRWIRERYRDGTFRAKAG